MRCIIVILTVFAILSVICAGLFFIVLINPTLFSTAQKSDQTDKLIDRIIPSNSIPQNQMGVSGPVTIHAIEPEVPSSIRLYRGIFHEGDYVDKSFDEVFKDRTNVTSEQDAPAVARIALEPYGGLPPDAEIGEVETNYYELYTPLTHEVVERNPIYTDVFYHRVIDGMPLLGFSDKIQVTLGENGKVLEILKIWRTLEYTGRNVSIISARTATEKLAAGEVLDPPMGMDDIQIHTIKLGYYEKSRKDPEIYLEPVWVFQGNTTSGTPREFLVYARQFANFTATQTSGRVPLNVTFTDTSDASPVKWLWDFGDGTNSTVQNPVHRYTAAGSYNVSLKVWNDLGSDTMEKPAYITVRLPAPPVANFTGSPRSGVKPLKVSFNDTSTNEPAGWRWTFGDGTKSTNRHPVHTYTSAGNFTVSLNVTNSDGSNSTVKTRYIHVSSQPPTTTPTTTPTTQPTTTATTPPTTKPTPTKTQSPVSPIVAVAGVGAVGILYVYRNRRGL